MTAAMAFKPKRDDGIAEWRLLFDVLRRHEIGDVIPYSEFDEALGRPFVAQRSPMTRAIHELRSECSRSVECVRSEGYRILHPREHRAQANSYRRRSRRAMGTAVEVAQSTEMALLSSDERRAIQATQVVLGYACMAIDDLTRKQKATEETLARVVTNVADVESTVEEHDEQLSMMAKAMKQAGLLQ